MRKKPWVTEAMKEFSDIVITLPDHSNQGRWRDMMGRDCPLHVELGTGRGGFLTEVAKGHPAINYMGIEAEQDVLYSAAQKVREAELTNIRLLVFDINFIVDIFAPGEVDRLYINFCDPWPKNRHAKRRLTHVDFLSKYKTILAQGGELFFKTDNRALFEFSLGQFEAAGLMLSNITFDLHHSGYEGNVRTEYETKFSAKGLKICRCEAKFPAEGI